eukprot:4937303-Amphidinium_carterae.1
MSLFPICPITEDVGSARVWSGRPLHSRTLVPPNPPNPEMIKIGEVSERGEVMGWERPRFPVEYPSAGGCDERAMGPTSAQVAKNRKIK